MFFSNTPAQLDPGVITHSKTQYSDYVKMHACYNELDNVVIVFK